VPRHGHEAASFARPVHTDGKNGDQASLRKWRPRRQAPTTVLSTDRGGCHPKSRVGRRNRGMLSIQPAAVATGFRRRHFVRSTLQPPQAPVRAENSKALLPQVIAPNARYIPSRSRLALILPQANTFTDRIVHERHVTQRLAYRPSDTKRPLRLPNALLASPNCHSPRSSLIELLSSDGGPRLTRMLQGLHP
jgi:hypothetical protein